MNLQELKALSTKELSEIWWRAEFPFDEAVCGYCLTQHGNGMCSDPEHVTLVKVARARDGRAGDDDLRERLEELYAQRLFFRSFYALTPLEKSQPIEEMVEAT